MKIRKANRSDLSDIMLLVRQAQAYLKEHHVNQWQNQYPNEEIILQDIDKKCFYVLEEKHLIGCMYFAVENDPNYEKIDGNWITEGSCGVIHRIIIDSQEKGKGRAKLLLDEAEHMCQENNVTSIRIDTHEDNLSMRRFLKKNSFVECGIILIDGISPRIAYEKKVQNRS